MRLLIESVRDYAIFMLDPLGHVATWNPGAEQLKGYRANDIIGEHFSRFYPTSDVVAGKCEFELTMAAKDGRFEDEGWRVRKDGTLFWANVVISAVREADGELIGFAKVTRDLTERRKAEEERAALKAAEEANRTKDEFLAMLGHELRNPLAPIVTALELIKMRGESVPQELSVIERQVQHVVRLVDDLLDTSRIKQGKLELRRTTFEIADVVAKAIEIANPLLEQRHHLLTVNVPTDGLTVNADITRMAQVFGNLLNNAAKYTPPGGRIEIAASLQGDDVVTRITDNGVGIPWDMLGKVFELFVQGERRPDRAEGGLGIGLTLVRSLVQLHGGSVVATSEGTGKGASFIVSLPFVASGTVDERAHVPSTHHAPVSRRILLVDDNEDAAVLLGDLLRRAGHDVRVTHDGPSALTCLQGFTPDVAVLDIGLPVMDGYDLAIRIRERLGSHCTLIALTGYGGERDRERSAAAGFATHLVKPIDAQLLLDQVKNSGD